MEKEPEKERASKKLKTETSFSGKKLRVCENAECAENKKRLNIERVMCCLIDSTPDCIAAVDAEMNFIAFNNSFYTQFKTLWGTELRLGMTFEEAHKNHPDKAEELRRIWKRCFEETIVMELKFGTEYFEIRGSPIFDDDGQLIGAAHIAHNISSRIQANNVTLLNNRMLEQSVEERTKQLEQSHALLELETETRKNVQRALEESEIRYRSLAEATNAVTWTWNEKGQFSKPVASWENFTGQSWPQYEHDGWLHVFPKDSQKALQEELQTALQQKTTYRTIARLWSKSTCSFRHVLIHITPIYRQHPHEIVEWVGAAVDIHALKQAEEDLRHLSWRLNLTMQSAKVGTWSYDIENGVCVLDSATAGFYGVDWLEGPVTELIDVIHADDREAVRDHMKYCKEGKRMLDVEFRIIRKDGTIIYLSGRGELVVDTKTRRKIIFGINLDITERKQLELEKIEAINRAKEQERIRAEEAERNHKRGQEFVDTICHEIRNPLSGIVGGASLLQDVLQEAQCLVDKMDGMNQQLKRCLERASDHLDSITKSANQQKAVVDDVLDMSRLVSNKLSLNHLPVDLKLTLASLVQMFQPQVILKGLTLSLDLPKEDLLVSTDILRLNQVVLNLLSNAIKFTAHGSITLRVTKEKTVQDHDLMLRFEVMDTGIGIAAEDLPKIFDRFTSASQRQGQAGTGLGLAISKRLVEAFGGKITATSQLSTGTCFVFTIPCKQVSQQDILAMCKPHTPRDTSAVVSEPLTILIVEDNAVNQKILLTYLTRQNYCCQVAWNGVEALEKCNQYQFDLIFMDVEMPVMDGIAATQAIRIREKESNGKRVPIVGLSGNARQAQQQEALHAGMDDYLTKPYHRDEVLALIAKYANRHNKETK